MAWPSLDRSRKEMGMKTGQSQIDSELMLSDDEDEDSTILVSRLKAEKPLAADDDSKPGALCPLDLDVQDMCKRAATRLSIPWAAIQAEVVKSRFDRKKLPKARKTGKHVLPVFPELLDKIAVTWRDKPPSREVLCWTVRAWRLMAYVTCHRWSRWLQATFT
ncbi:hypothetical protein AMECASPLE_016039 [Ameca splendens]|uniref:Uncharacterized protein n=1 Tax=Ameca splendens TaxID=208324 RepID=A0ABV0YDJ9_9TELE